MTRQKIITISILSGLALAGLSATAQAGKSIWTHNGSQMMLESNGNSRVITYLYPRRGISARPGQILFQGHRVGNQYIGTAYTFRRGCQPAPYNVSATLHSETRIVLRGASPRRNGCQVTGYTNRSGNSKLVFTYLRKPYVEGYGTDNEEPGPQYQPTTATTATTISAATTATIPTFATATIPARRPENFASAVYCKAL